MSAASAAQVLPTELLAKASLSGNEYAWRIKDIPAVIDAACRANLINIGGQLQFLIPKAGTCECYWVSIDTYKKVSKASGWQERVTQTAAVANADFESLMQKFDFVAEGRNNFELLAAFETKGGSLPEAMWFVWYVLGHNEAAAQGL